MYKMYFILVFFLFYLQSSAFAEAIKYYVVSPEGLDLRATPDKDAALIAKVPFATLLEEADTNHYCQDTLGKYEYLAYSQNFKRDQSIEITGKWIKVNYKGKTAFAFDFYLAQQSLLKDWDFANAQSDFALLFPGENCTPNMPDPTAYNWYGVYSKEDSYEIRPVEIGYFQVNYEEAFFPVFGITSNDNKDLNFIIGRKGKMDTQKIKGHFFDFDQGNLQYFPERQKEILVQLGIHLEEQDQERGDLFSGLMLEENATSQQIDACHHGFPLSVLWIGDLDGDGSMDYIIDFEGEFIYATLFLSSKADGENLVKAVASHYWGFVCGC